MIATARGPLAPPAASAGDGPQQRVVGARRVVGIRVMPWGVGRLRRVEGRSGRAVYLETRCRDGRGYHAWIVHADGAPGEPARQHVCATLAAASALLAAELDGRPASQAGGLTTLDGR
jgi:hypothetical protein